MSAVLPSQLSHRFIKGMNKRPVSAETCWLSLWFCQQGFGLNIKPFAWQNKHNHSRSRLITFWLTPLVTFLIIFKKDFFKELIYFPLFSFCLIKYFKKHGWWVSETLTFDPDPPLDKWARCLSCSEEQKQSHSCCVGKQIWQEIIKSALRLIRAILIVLPPCWTRLGAVFTHCFLSYCDCKIQETQNPQKSKQTNKPSTELLRTKGEQVWIHTYMTLWFGAYF